ncbi:MAG: ChaN family lipoprotein [Nitrospirae bacterium]|nr:ChaN family lipoprotein [Nitrospirota bacterium]
MKKFIFLLFLNVLFISTADAGINPLRIKHPLCNLSVSFDIKQNLIKGISKIELPETGEINIYTGSLKIISVMLNGQPLMPEIKKGLFKVVGKGTIEITYEGVFREEDVEVKPGNRGVVYGNVIAEKGIYLTQGWYPSIRGMAYYNLKALIPEGFIAISEADGIHVSETGQGLEYSFDFPYPVHGINLVAGNYIEIRETFNGIDIYAYFFPEDVPLAKTYIEYTKRYIGMYEDLLIPYPYGRFSVVENFLPTGYSMPAFTLLGQDVVRLPFIVETSLGHEILHQWFGNSVYVDYKTGNWSEGLTTYLSDHLYKEMEGKGWEYRKKLLTDYESYVTPEKEFTLRDFTGRFDFASRAIGYGKGAMVFHMLKNMIGDDSFYDGLREFLKENRFKEASWDDLRINFEKVSGKKLDWFFDQWFNRKGIPSIEITNPDVIVLEGIPTIFFRIVQKGELYNFSVSLEIKTGKEEISRVLDIKNEIEKFEIPVKGTPLNMVFDRNYDIMRRLSGEEYPPVISGLLGDERRLIVIPEKESENYSELIEVLKEQGFGIKSETDITDQDIKTSSLLVLEAENTVLKRFFGKVPEIETGFTFEVRKNPLKKSKVVAIAQSESKEEVDHVARKILHYGNYSFLRFEKGRNTEKKTYETERGINISLYKPVPVMRPQDLIELDRVIDAILDKPVIYVGERHTNYEDHKVQLKVIMSLYENNRKFAIGMEMFQRPFQKAIDEYISGAIGEREFLKNTEYFKRWRHDYNHYREIIEFAKAKNIPVIALNIRSEIIKKVSEEGLDSLTEPEKMEIPETMDMSDEDYRRRLKDIFEQHKRHESRNFDYFYQSQILWDETMAHTINDFLKKNPGYQIAVLAGAGHIMFGSGIPKRAYRLNGEDYVILIPSTEKIESDIGDFVFLSEHMSPPATPKLGIRLKQEDKRVKAEKIQPGSIAHNAGLEEGDIFVSFDDWKIKETEDIKIFMTGKKQGDKFKIKVLRKKFLAGYGELEFNIVL